MTHSYITNQPVSITLAEWKEMMRVAGYDMGQPTLPAREPFRDPDPESWPEHWKTWQERALEHSEEERRRSTERARRWELWDWQRDEGRWLDFELNYESRVRRLTRENHVDDAFRRLYETGFHVEGWNRPYRRRKK